MPIKSDVAIRLAAGYRVTPSGCWEWQRNLTPKGYGEIHRDGRTRRAHRVAYELYVGPIPAGACVCHRCDNPSCIYPGHLFLGTHADNSADRVAKGRSCAPKRPATGERNGQAKLTADHVRRIRELHARGEPAVAIAVSYGITPTQVGNVVKRRSWANA